MANTFKFGNGNWAVKDGYALAYNDENNNFKPLPFDFTRASSATRVNKQGLIETVGSGKPRIDFTDNTDGHLLLEPSRTNFLTYSEGFSNWTLNGDSISETSNTAFGKTIWTLTESSTTKLGIYRTATSVTTGTVTASALVKANTSDLFRLRYGSPQNSNVDFDLSNGTVTSQSPNTSATITSYGGGWYLCTNTVTITSSTQSFAIYTNSGSIDVIHAQLEAGSYATSYIPTEGSSVTRVLDEADQTGVQQVIGQTEGTLYLEFVPLDASALQILFQIRSSSGSVGQIDLRLQSGSIRTLGSDDGSTQFSFSGGSYTVGTTYKVAVRYKTNDSKLYINGSSVGSDTNCSFTSSTKAQISFSENVGTNFHALAKIKDARLYDTALTDTELQNLTS